MDQTELLDRTTRSGRPVFFERDNQVYVDVEALAELDEDGTFGEHRAAIMELEKAHAEHGRSCVQSRA